MRDRNNNDLTVLVVEDLNDHSEYITYLLKKRGFNVIMADNGELALREVDSIKVDCALIDINLGDGINGLQLMNALRKRDIYKDLPIISVTAYYSRGVRREMKERGFTDLIAKPFNYTQLYDTIDKYLYLNN